MSHLQGNSKIMFDILVDKVPNYGSCTQDALELLRLSLHFHDKINKSDMHHYVHVYKNRFGNRWTPLRDFVRDTTSASTEDLIKSCVHYAWISVADANDIRLYHCNHHLLNQKRKLASAKKRKREEKIEEKELRKKYKAQTGKRFRFSKKYPSALAELRSYPFPEPLELKEEVSQSESDEEFGVKPLVQDTEEENTDQNECKFISQEF